MSEDKLQFYIKRTMHHIWRVQRNIMTLVMDPEYRRILDITEEEIPKYMMRAVRHDQSKFSAEQYQAYVDFSWYMHQKRTDPEVEQTEKEKKAFEDAWEHHYMCEMHHPERMAVPGSQFMMGKISLVETACDLQAMAQEFGEFSGREYFDKTWKRKQYNNFPTPEDFDRAVHRIELCFDCFEREADVLGEPSK